MLPHSRRLTARARVAKHRPVFRWFGIGLLLLGCAGTSDKPRARVDKPGLPLTAASEDDLARFRDGDALFEATVRESDGLGPLYVRDSCAACHQGDGRGPGFVTKLIGPARSLPFGTSERPFVAAGAKQALLSPSDTQVRSVRRLPPAVFGRGYLEAIADTEIERLARLAASRTGTVRGRPNRLKNGAIGRFGLKARLATLEEFTADALNGDMGMTTPQRPDEPQGPEGLRDDAKPGVDFEAIRVTRISDYVRLLEIPMRVADETGASELFERVGCALCHVPALHTQASFRVPALSDIDAPIYSDLLLHDMGEARSDGQFEEAARPSEFRTAPLIGLRFLPTLLHDGSARTVVEAIEAHAAPGSEGQESVRAYHALGANERARLSRFVETL